VEKCHANLMCLMERVSPESYSAVNNTQTTRYEFKKMVIVVPHTSREVTPKENVYNAYYLYG
jgi:hypothetical protein